MDPTVVFARSEVPDAYPRALSHVGDRVDVRRAGIDATFSAPKSVSVLFGLADKDVAGQVLTAHAEAVTQTLAYLEPSRPGSCVDIGVRTAPRGSWTLTG